MQVDVDPKILHMQNVGKQGTNDIYGMTVHCFTIVSSSKMIE
ncbi:similar to An08g11220 [Aspergillus luchuensis]|uniref:Similar to An08g11220 n=1 Tax=Aspergillus kawachii TaxID=1069201 RepID=A0A146FAN2_ASPKA|nr:similar to An08g11220 [Aspergillus luchuensis]